MDIQSVANRVPDIFKKPFRETFLEEIFKITRSKLLGTTKVTFSTPSGNRELLVKEGWWFLEKFDEPISYESALMEDIIRIVDSNTVFYDVGSQWGIILDVVSTAGVPPEQIHGFEVSEENYQISLENHSSKPFNLNNVYVGATEDGTGIITLDSYAESHASPTVVKIDVEGAEGRVIEGMQCLIVDQQPIIYLEIHPEMINSKDTPKEIIGELIDAGYTVQCCLENRESEYEWRGISRVTLPENGDYLIKATPEPV